MQSSSKIVLNSILITAIIVLINLVADQLYFRLDFTADQRYTLSQATEEIVKELDDIVTITAYFSEDLPPQLIQTRRDFEDLLFEYEKLSGGNLVYQFINPNEDEETEREAQQRGIGPIIVNVTENDKVQQLKAYLGAYIQYGERDEIIPLIQPGSSMEYVMTTAIKKVSVTDKPIIGLLQGHGEAGLEEIFQLQEQLSVLYEVEPFQITDTSAIPSFYKAVAIINPSDTISIREFERLNQYLAEGGNIFLSYSHVTGDLSSGAYLQKSPDIGIINWLAGKGVVLPDQFVTDVNSASVSVRQQQGYFVINSQVQFPFFPILRNFEEHPITSGIESLLLPFACPIQISAVDSTMKYQSLAFTSEQSGLVDAPTFFDINKRWTAEDFPETKQLTAVALESNTMGRMVLISNGNFAVNGSQRQQLNQDNINFASNAIDWLSDDTGLIDLRTKGVTSRPLETVEDDTKNLLKYGNVIAPIVLILAYGFIRRQRSQAKRQRWQQDNY
jgi:gliding-associated putative ABC transporter substrate-binding component GldG